MKNLKVMTFLVSLFLISCAKEKDDSSDSGYKYEICGQVQQSNGSFMINANGNYVQLQANSQSLQEQLFNASSSGQSVCAYSDKELQQGYMNSSSGMVFIVEKVKGGSSNNNGGSNGSYNYKYCGTIQNNGNGYYLNSQGNYAYIYPNSSQAQQQLSNLGSSSRSGCVHSNQQIQQSQQGYTVQADYISY